VSAVPENTGYNFVLPNWPWGPAACYANGPEVYVPGVRRLKLEADSSS